LTRLRLQDELARIVEHEKSTVLLVTHDVDEAVFLADRIVVLQPNPGQVARIVNVDLDRQRDRSAPAFVRLRDEVLEVLGVRHAVREAAA
jgi:sulfonate transport system ATP-binding protein